MRSLLVLFALFALACARCPFQHSLTPSEKHHNRHASPSGKYHDVSPHRHSTGHSHDTQLEELGCPSTPELSSVAENARRLVDSLPKGQSGIAQLKEREKGEKGYFGRFFHTTSPGCITNARLDIHENIEKLTQEKKHKYEWLPDFLPDFLKKKTGKFIKATCDDNCQRQIKHGLFAKKGDYKVDFRWSNASPGPVASISDQRGLAMKIYETGESEHMVSAEVLGWLGLQQVANPDNSETDLTKTLASTVFDTTDMDIILSTAEHFPLTKDETASSFVSTLATEELGLALRTARNFVVQSLTAVFTDTQNPIAVLSKTNESGNRDEDICSRNPFTVPYFSQAAFRLGADDETHEDAKQDLLKASEQKKSTFVRYMLVPCDKVCERYECSEDCPGYKEGDTKLHSMQQTLEKLMKGDKRDPKDMCFDLILQVAGSGTFSKDCVEDVTADWKHASYYRVGKVTFGEAGRMEEVECEKMTFNPFNARWEHLPIGLNRMRLLTYAVSQQKRLAQPGYPGSEAGYRSAPEEEKKALEEALEALEEDVDGSEEE